MHRSLVQRGAFVKKKIKFLAMDRIKEKEIGNNSHKLEDEEDAKGTIKFIAAGKVKERESIILVKCGQSLVIV